MTFRIHFQDVEHSNFLHEKCETLSRALQQEFPETLRFEVTMTQNGEERATQVHVTGKDVDFASTASSKSAPESVNDAFDRLRKQLRKHHDKLIFKRRREVRSN